MKIITVIPTKVDSKRLPKKNILNLDDMPLFMHSVQFARVTSHENRIIVSSESLEVARICEKYGVEFHLRDKSLCGDTEVVDVYKAVANSINETYDLFVGLQPDNPDRSYELDSYINYMLENNYEDLVTVNNDYKRSGSVRLMYFQKLQKLEVSGRLGIIKDDATDIHYKEDLEKVKLKLK